MTDDIQTAPTFSLPSRGPLILGASGRIGTAFRHLWQAGLWPSSAVPLWQSRQPLGHFEGVQAGLDPAGLAQIAVTARGVRTRGIIVLAGATTGDADTLAFNTQAAQAAVILRALGAAGPIICLSSAAVYGAEAGPHAESDTPNPTSPYGAAKLAMEQAMAPHDGVTCLRLANVPGADALLGGMTNAPVALDRISEGDMTDSAGATGTGPQRSYIGPLSLARSLLALLEQDNLPKVMNLAQPGLVDMASLLHAADAKWHWQEAPATALPAVELNTDLLGKYIDLPRANAAELVAEARAAGWRNPQTGRAGK